MYNKSFVASYVKLMDSLEIYQGKLLDLFNDEISNHCEFVRKAKEEKDIFANYGCSHDSVTSAPANIDDNRIVGSKYGHCSFGTCPLGRKRR